MSSYIFFRIEARRKILDPIRCYIHSYTLCCCFLFERIRDFDLLRRFFILDFVINREMSNCCIITEVSIIYQFFSLSCLGCSIWAVCIQRTTMVFKVWKSQHYSMYLWHTRILKISIAGMLQNLHELICKMWIKSITSDVWTCLKKRNKNEFNSRNWIHIEML